MTFCLWRCFHCYDITSSTIAYNATHNSKCRTQCTMPHNIYLTNQPDLSTWPGYPTYLPDLPTWPTHLTKKTFSTIQTLTRAVSQFMRCFVYLLNVNSWFTLLRNPQVLECSSSQTKPGHERLCELYTLCGFFGIQWFKSIWSWRKLVNTAFATPMVMWWPKRTQFYT